MNVVESEILRQFHYTLTTTVKGEGIALLLYSKKAIDEKILREILEKKGPKIAEMSSIFTSIPSRCSMKDFLECLDEAGYDFLSNEIKIELLKNRKQNMCNWVQPCTSAENTTYVDHFAEKLKTKIHNSEARKFECDIKVWIKRLLCSDCNLSPWESRQRADCCFVLLDSIAVIQRTHSSHRDLWRSSVFSQMESLIAKTSNPNLSRIRHHARYGVALFLGGKDKEGLQYIEAALSDAKTFLVPGRYIGNCVYALVNYKLKRFGESKSLNEKREILNLIEEGLRYFDNEDENIRKIWRGVYLDKKISCHLALGPSGRIISNLEITSEDLKTAKVCLCEMDQNADEMDKRRKIHFYRAKARLCKQECNYRIAKGYLEQALELCIDGGFDSELQVLKEELGDEDEPLDLSENDSVMDSWKMGDVLSESQLCSCKTVCSSSYSIVNSCITEISQKLNIETATPSLKRKLLDNCELEGNEDSVKRTTCASNNY
jgi:tetratricopeptide (TPR) repeat protein